MHAKGTGAEGRAETVGTTHFRSGAKASTEEPCGADISHKYAKLEQGWRVHEHASANEASKVIIRTRIARLRVTLP